MLFDLHTGLAAFLKQATRRVDGIALYAIVGILAVAATVFLYRSDWKLATGAILMVPLTFVLYVRLSMLSSRTPSSRAINAALLVAFPFALYWLAV